MVDGIRGNATVALRFLYFEMFYWIVEKNGVFSGFGVDS